MIIRYAFENFGSFASRAEISFAVDDKARPTDWVAETPLGRKVSKVLVLMGANGSGKTTALRALGFLPWFISYSWAAPAELAIPVAPHAAKAAEPCRFEIEFEAEGRLWRYFLACTRERVLEERLDVKQVRFRNLFDRRWSEDESKTVYSAKDKEFHMADRQVAEIRDNCSVIATAAQWGLPLAERLQRWFITSFAPVSSNSATILFALDDASRKFAENSRQKDTMQRLLTAWDLGLNGIDIVETQIPNAPPDAPAPTASMWVPWGVHKSGDHAFKLPFRSESSGTISAYVMLSRALPILENGGVCTSDEIENNLHPHMLEEFLDLFARTSTNPKNAQIIFSTHSPEVLKYLEKYQIILIEKTDCESACYRLDSISGIRSDENIYAKYLAGRYGAIPQF